MRMRRAMIGLVGVGLGAAMLAALCATPAGADAPDTDRAPIVVAQAMPPAGNAAPAPSDRVTNPAPPSSQIAPAASAQGEDGPKAYLTFKTPYEFFLCLITVGLGIGTSLLLVLMYWRRGPTEDFIRAFIVVAVIFSALFLIVAGYNEKQTAPVFGLLGTILGYVFGKVQAAPDKPPP